MSASRHCLTLIDFTRPWAVSAEQASDHRNFIWYSNADMSHTLSSSLQLVRNTCSYPNAMRFLRIRSKLRSSLLARLAY